MHREYLREEQRSQTPGSPPRVSQRGGVEMGCIAVRMQMELHHGLPRSRTWPMLCTRPGNAIFRAVDPGRGSSRFLAHLRRSDTVQLA